MINWLKVSKSAHFYRRKKRVSNNAVGRAFRTIRNDADNPSQNIFYAMRQVHDGATYSAVSFFYDRDPAFLDAPRANPKERVCGYILLVEHANYLVLFKSGLDFPASFKTTHMQKLGPDRIETAIARADATFEQIRLRVMAATKYSLRSKTLEADNLETVVGPAGANRYISRGYRVRRGSEHHSATPTTGMISTRSDRVGYEDLISWAKVVIDLLDDPNAVVSTFISAFARPMDFASLPAGTLPTYLAIDTAVLREQLFDLAPPVRAVREANGAFTPLTKAETDTILTVLDQEFSVRKVRGDLQLRIGPQNEHVGEINLGKTRLSLRSLALAELKDIHVESTNQAEQEKSRLPMRRYIDHNDLFTVLFDDASVVYIDGALYKDNALSDGGDRVLRYIRPEPLLNNITDEKGAFVANQQAFDATSVFRAIIDGTAAADETLICDDLVDEWADFIGISVGSSPKTISFYHAKGGEPSLGAGHMHVAVSQATKNLGRMNLTPNEIAGKLAKWRAQYVNDNAATHIDRTIRGDALRLEAKIGEATRAPDTIRRVYIVTTSLSRRALEAEFGAIQRGARAKPHFVQLYWLLMSYVSACTEVGAFPYIVCRE